MKRLLTIACLSLSTVAFAAEPNKSDSSPQQSGQQSGQQQSSDQQFIRQQIGIAEYQLQSGKLAESKAQDESIKSYAKSQIEQSERSLEQLNRISSQNGTKPGTLTNNSPEMSPVQQAMIAELRQLDGKNFERAYTFQQIAQQRYNTLECMWQSENAQSTDIKQYAQSVCTSSQPSEMKAQQMASLFLPNWHGNGATAGHDKIENQK